MSSKVSMKSAMGNIDLDHMQNVDKKFPFVGESTQIPLSAWLPDNVPRHHTCIVVRVFFSRKYCSNHVRIGMSPGNKVHVINVGSNENIIPKISNGENIKAKKGRRS